MTKNKKITSSILSAAILVFTAGCSDNSDSVDLGENTDHTEATEESPKTVYGDPVIGGNSILSQDTRGDITATFFRIL